MSAKIDIIVLGATGYTGRITCRYLKSLGAAAGTWAMAGRNRDKLEALKRELGVSVPSFIMDTTKPETLDAICAQAGCIISCAGPFTKVGMPVVEACVRNAVDYVDSTGEFNFVRKVAERYHDEAVKKGIVLVSCCGFDSVPADLGNYVVHREAKEEVRDVRSYYDFVSAGISCGTANSLGCVVEAMERRDLDPCSLVPRGGLHPHAAPTRVGLWYENGRFTAPFVMAATNERVVRRTNSFLKSAATYSEAAEGGLLKCLFLTIGHTLLFLLMAIGPIRRLAIGRLFPADTGLGPSDQHKAKSEVKCTFVGTTASGRRVETVLYSKKDMYDLTGIFLVQCAKSAIALRAAHSTKPGVLTPAAAFGDELVGRCRNSGLQITTTVV